MILRLVKISLVAATALYFTLVALTNLLDPQINLNYVTQVLSMDGIESHAQQWRSLHSPVIHKMAFILIIATELSSALLCWFGTFKLIKHLHQSADHFNQQKTLAIAGLGLGILLLFLGFVVIGNEWFLIWQTTAATAVIKAATYSGVLLLVLLLLIHKEIE